ncbi:hypothetical protein ABZ461_39405 [Actinacidiphila glaucinigra]|uniref:hypothetical protein n=1 Tax=Actinacidiphila glaucinigra TaxID=235986 RepID=UPI0033E80B3F
MSAAEEEQRVSGTCARCQKHTEDGRSYLVESGSGPGGIFVLCADTRACRRRESTSRPRMNSL